MCRDLHEGRLAVIGIGNNPTLSHLETIATVLNIPFLSIKWNDNHDNEPLVISNPNQKTIEKKEDDEDNYIELDENYMDMKDAVNSFSLNMHSPSSKVMNAVYELSEHYKWDFITILYEESLGLEHIQDLIRLPTIYHIEKATRIQVRQLSSNLNEWIYLLKDIKLSGSNHIIVDIQTKYLNDFIRQVILNSRLNHGML